ncbi:glycosyl transferase family 1 [Croceicoccus estronivorus]|uniref:glycosyltransferase family 4 protein n=1 Tax=Croceicoccus estronivorus TaxID=1172626 RepID=UPI00082EBDB1|nr:glycosyltransferase family 4 protein [Croceicoccus estronivorus]OCC24954.1 glycosyl transferase family 1 [Croceicoccus estronivorus]
MSKGQHPLRFLHLHSTFDAGGKELRCARLINAFGSQITHTIVSAEPRALSAGRHISPSIPVVYPGNFPALEGFPAPWRLRRIADAMRGFDLVLTYNWGAMDAVMAHTIFAAPFGLPPLVHHEDGFNADEVNGLKRSRNWYRRLALGRADALVVPSSGLERVARDVWFQPAAKIHRIANGIATGRFNKKPRKDALPRLIKRRGERWVGTLSGLRPVKNLPRLVRAFSGLPDHWHLVILGEGPERDVIREEATRCNIVHRVHLPGFADPADAVGLFDIFALSSDSEQFPLSVVEAMATGLPVAAPAVGDVMQIVASENRPFIVAPGEESALSDALWKLADDPALRETIGRANRERARLHFDEAGMIAAYRALYAGLIGRDAIP